MWGGGAFRGAESNAEVKGAVSALGGMTCPERGFFSLPLLPSEIHYNKLPFPLNNRILCQPCATEELEDAGACDSS